MIGKVVTHSRLRSQFACDTRDTVSPSRLPIDLAVLSTTTPFLGMKVQFGGGEGTGRTYRVVVVCDVTLKQVPAYRHYGLGAIHFICDQGHQPADVWLSSQRTA